MNNRTQARSLVYGAISAALCTGITIGGCHWATQHVQEPEPVMVIPETVPVIGADDLWRDNFWSDDRSRIDEPLVSADLPAETQWTIFEQCGQDVEFFCTVMAIAATESDFDSQTIGDGGDSIGMMQINTRWHTERMEALGVEDLTDPVQCAVVAIDYLLELEDIMDAGPGEHSLYMSYNAGPDSAKRKIQTGTSSTAYSETAMSFYWEYIAEMGVMAPGK